jgi:hypothetical protein
LIVRLFNFPQRHRQVSGIYCPPNFPKRIQGLGCLTPLSGKLTQLLRLVLGSTCLTIHFCMSHTSRMADARCSGSIIAKFLSMAFKIALPTTTPVGHVGDSPAPFRWKYQSQSPTVNPFVCAHGHKPSRSGAIVARTDTRHRNTVEKGRRHARERLDTFVRTGGSHQRNVDNPF